MTQKISSIDPTSFNNKVLERNGKLGKDACDIMAAALKAVDPYDCVSNYLGSNDLQKAFQSYERLFLIGFGKASVPMAKAAIDFLNERITHAQVITKDEKFLKEDGYKNKLRVHLGGHPIPTSDSLDSTQAILEGLPELSKRDLVLVVISGGGSALFSNPLPHVFLEDLQKMTQALLNSGADIHEINTLRKHLDQVKGGGLALQLQPAMLHTFILSDVIGDRLDMIASGPTVPDPTTYHDTLKVIARYDLESQIPHAVMKVLNLGASGKYPETLKKGQIQPGRVVNHLIGSNVDAAMAAKRKANQLGYRSLVMSTHLTGLTEHVVEFLDGIIQTERSHHQHLEKPACLIFGGETTVEVTGDGLGGRNQDLALRMVPKLDGAKGVLFISLATDGEDGPTDAAGAVTDSQVLQEAEGYYDLDINAYIKNNNSYHFFEKVGGLIQIGSTGTNVNDLILILVNGD